MSPKRSRILWNAGSHGMRNSPPERTFARPFSAERSIPLWRVTAESSPAARAFKKSSSKMNVRAGKTFTKSSAS